MSRHAGGKRRKGRKGRDGGREKRRRWRWGKAEGGGVGGGGGRGAGGGGGGGFGGARGQTRNGEEIGVGHFGSRRAAFLRRRRDLGKGEKAGGGER